MSNSPIEKSFTILKIWPNEKNNSKYNVTINPDFLAFLRIRVSMMNETDVIPSMDKSGKIISCIGMTNML